MTDKLKIEFFEAWYDIKFHPDDPEIRKRYDDLLSEISKLLEDKFTSREIENALRGDFIDWQIKNGYPKPPKKP